MKDLAQECIERQPGPGSTGHDVFTTRPRCVLVCDHVLSFLTMEDLGRLRRVAAIVGACAVRMARKIRGTLTSEYETSFLEDVRICSEVPDESRASDASSVSVVRLNACEDDIVRLTPKGNQRGWMIHPFFRFDHEERRVNQKIDDAVQLLEEVEVSNEEILRNASMRAPTPADFVKNNILVKLAAGLWEGAAGEWARGIWGAFRYPYVAADGHDNLPIDNKPVNVKIERRNYRSQYLAVDRREDL